MDVTITDEDSWAQECTKWLKECVGKGAVTGRDEWARLSSAVPLDRYIRIKDADFSGMDVSGFDFTYCKLRDVQFLGSNLSHSIFRQAIARGCDFSNSDVRGATFQEADLRTSIMRNVHADDATNLALISGGFPDHMDGLLRDRAEAELRRREFARDRSRGSLHKWVVKTIGYGESVKRLITAALIVIAGFASLFRAVDAATTSSAKAVVYSLQYFVALSDPYADSNFALSAAGTVEAALGLVFLAFLLSALARHLLVNR